MTAGQRKTAIVLGVWVGLQVVLGLGLLGWEFYSLTLGDHATITETTHVMWASQPWAFLLVGVVVTGIVAFLAGHFFGAPSGHYDEVRRRGFVVLLLAALASMAATCNRVGLPGTQGCAPDQYPVRIPCDDAQRGKGECVACIRVGTSPPSSIYPEVSPEPSSTPEPRPSPVPPSPSTHPPPSPESSPSPVATPRPTPSPEATPKPCVTPAPRDPNRAPCAFSQAQLTAIPCWWGARQRLDWEAAKDDANRTWDTDGKGLFWPRAEGSSSLWAVKCRTAAPWDRCEMANGQHAGGPVAERVFGPDYDPARGELGNGVCSRAYLESLCPPEPAPCPVDEPSPGPTPTPTPPVGGSCGPLVRIGGGLHNCQVKGVPVKCKNADGSVAVQAEGGKVTVDTTGHWRNGGPGSCDEDRDRSSPWCNGRICDDPVRGMVFRVLRGGSPCHKTGSHQYTCGPLVRGPHAIEACPDPEWSDEAGVRVDVSGTTCAVIEWEVQ